ncbi:MAG: serine/threonine protein kinase [Kofleriaceae bacterium]
MTTSPEKFGRYIVHEQLATGGMSQIHLADVPSKDGSTRRVALKRLLPQFASNKEIRALFVEEGRVMRYLHHPNIPETYDSGRVDDTFYIAMQYVPGPTLKELIHHVKDTVGSVPIPITVNISSQLCEALEHAHNQKDEKRRPLDIIHRDISPSNVIISDAGVVKLIDFGLAKVKGSSVNTDEGVIKGKFNYVAPEYLGGKLDARVDLWAIGVMMYEMFTGRRLFEASDDFETLGRVRKMPIPRPSRANPELGPDLDEIVMRALQRDPSLRWQTAGQMRDALLGVTTLPENFVDNERMLAWVAWVMMQPPGTSAKQAPSLVGKPPRKTKQSAVAPPPRPRRSSTRRNAVRDDKRDG